MIKYRETLMKRGTLCYVEKNPRGGLKEEGEGIVPMTRVGSKNRTPDCVSLKSFVPIANSSRGASGIGASPASEGAESPTEDRRGAERVKRTAEEGRRA